MVCRGCALLFGSLFHFTQQDAVVVQILAGILAELLQQIVEDYKKAHNGASVYAPTFIEDCEAEVKKLQEEYGFEYTVEYVQ